MKKILFALVLLISTWSVFAQKTDTVYVQSDGVKLHSVITTSADMTSAPLAIIIAGSGPTDLNGNQTNMINNSLKYLSDSLVANGISTLRFDKRGIGKSAIPNMKEEDYTIDNLSDDVKTLITFCKSKGYSKIYIIGHSEGSLIGLMALQKEKIDGFISISGVGSSADEIIKKQIKPQLPPNLFAQTEEILDSLKNGFLVKEVPPQLLSLFRPSVQPYLISWFNQNPTELIKMLGCPILIIQGDNDIQVEVSEAQKLADYSKNCNLLIISNMNHVLKTIKGNIQENVKSYTDSDLPINSELVKGVVKFINKK